jgi:FkbM family methyltransferase
MKSIKEKVKKFLKIDPNSGVSPLGDMVYLGSKFHGYWLPASFLDKDSICYCVGAGDDISFDTELKVIYNSHIYIFDPTPASIAHFKALKEISRKNEQMPAVSQDSSFTYRVNYKQLEEMKFVEKGVWSDDMLLKFYDPEIENYVSHSAYLFKDSKKYVEFPVNSLKNFMKQFGHHSIDLVKLEIEGAEYEVIDSIIKDKPDIKMILVEFDEIFHKKGVAHHLRIEKYCKKLKDAGYILVHSNETKKRTFIREDVCEQLKSKEARA